MSFEAGDEVGEAREVAARRVGLVLNRKYRLDSVLGVGGMGAVYAATHRNGSRKAIKMLHPWISAHKRMRNRFLAEGYVANRIAHPCVAVVHDDDVDEEGSAYLVMDLLEGSTLEAHRLAAGGRLGEPVVLSSAWQLLDVLAVAHDAGIVHRDLKPENLFLLRDGLLKVLDFGIARVRELSAAPSQATGSGTSVGTPAFMAPEQALGDQRSVGPRSDVWAVGATMYTLLSGQFVHKGSTAAALLAAAAMRRVPPMTELLPSLDPALAALLDRALAFDPADRWPDARSMQAAVATACPSPEVLSAARAELANGAHGEVPGAPADGAATTVPAAGRNEHSDSPPDPATPAGGAASPAPSAGATPDLPPSLSPGASFATAAERGAAARGSRGRRFLLAAGFGVAGVMAVAGARMQGSGDSGAALPSPSAVPLPPARTAERNGSAPAATNPPAAPEIGLAPSLDIAPAPPASGSAASAAAGSATAALAPDGAGAVDGRALRARPSGPSGSVAPRGESRLESPVAAPPRVPPSAGAAATSAASPPSPSAPADPRARYD